MYFSIMCFFSFLKIHVGPAGKISGQKPSEYDLNIETMKFKYLNYVAVFEFFLSLWGFYLEKENWEKKVMCIISHHPKDFS